MFGQLVSPLSVYFVYSYFSFFYVCSRLLNVTGLGRKDRSIWKNEHNTELYIWLSPPRYPSQWIVFISGYKSSYYQPIKNRTPKFVIHTHVNIFLKLRLCVLIKKIFFSKWSEFGFKFNALWKIAWFFFSKCVAILLSPMDN